MKKKLALFFILAVSLMLCACGKTTEFVSQVHEIEGQSEKAPEDDIEFTGEETAAMLNFMLGNRYAYNGGRLFGLAHDSEGNELLCSMSKKMKKMDVIERGFDCAYLISDGDYLYYNRGESAICRVRTDLSAPPEILYSGECHYLQLLAEKLFFTDGGNHLISMNCDGSKAGAAYDKHSICYPYLWGEFLFFQNEDDGDSLWLYNFTSGDEKKLAEGPVYEYIWEGEKLSTDIGEYSWEQGDETAYMFVSPKAEVIASLKDGENLIDYITVYYADDGSSVVIPRGE